MEHTCTRRTLYYCKLLGEDPAQSVQLGSVQIGRGIGRPISTQYVDMSIVAASGLEHRGHVFERLLFDIVRGTDILFDIYDILCKGKSIKL